MERKSAWGVLGTYTVTHAAVDAACAVLLWTAYEDGRLSASAAWSAFFAYNLLAFAVQPLVGLAADRLRLGRGAAAGGALLTATAAAVALVPGAIWTAVVLAGLGNAVFHVGGGVVSLRAAPGRAGPVGVFVAPGAAGWPSASSPARPALRRGRWSRRWSSSPPPWPSSPPPGSDAAAPATSARPPQPRWRAPAWPSWRCCSSVVGVRAFVGLTLVLPWKSDLVLLAALTAAVVTGKAAGGLLADRFGWRRVAVTALVASLPLLALGASSPVAGVAGVLLFNMTMPVTLAAVAAVLPRGNEGFAFGLTCLALFCGSAPSLMGWPLASAPWLLAALILPAAAALWFALGGRGRRSQPGSAPLAPAAEGGRS